MAAVVADNYCCSRYAIIKWLEIAFSCVILGLSAPGNDMWQGYQYFVAVGAIGLIFAFLSLVWYVFGLHRSYETVPHVHIEAFMNFILILLNIACFAVAVWDAVVLSDGTVNHYHPTPLYDWRNRIAAVAAFAAANAILFFMSYSYSDMHSFRVVYWGV